jgi:hypothetical protein
MSFNNLGFLLPAEFADPWWSRSTKFAPGAWLPVVPSHNGTDECWSAEILRVQSLLETLCDLRSIAQRLLGGNIQDDQMFVFERLIDKHVLSTIKVF